MNKFHAFVGELRVSILRFKAVVKIPSGFMVAALTFITVATQTVTDLTPTMWQRGLLLAGLGVMTIILFRRWEKGFTRSEASFGQVDDGKLANRKALVVTLGLKSDRPDSAFAKLLSQAKNANAIALIVTHEVEDLNVLDRITKQLLPASGFSGDMNHVRTWIQGSAQSVADAHQCVTEALTWLLQSGYAPYEIAVDISDGRRPTHLGAAFAAQDLSVEVQYLGPQWNHVTDQPMEGSEAFKVVSELY